MLSSVAQLTLVAVQVSSYAFSSRGDWTEHLHRPIYTGLHEAMNSELISISNLMQNLNVHVMY